METLFRKLLGSERFERLDARISGAMARWGPVLLRYGLGLIFLWFGALKPLGMSPAEELVKQTVYFLPGDAFVSLLGWWEVLIGLGLLIRRFNRAALLLLALQMIGTFMPLILLPEVCFTSRPFGLTLEGQYIIKNLVVIGAALVVGGSVRSHGDAPSTSA